MLRTTIKYLTSLLFVIGVSTGVFSKVAWANDWAGVLVDIKNSTLTGPNAFYQLEAKLVMINAVADQTDKMAPTAVYEALVEMVQRSDIRHPKNNQPIQFTLDLGHPGIGENPFYDSGAPHAHPVTDIPGPMNPRVYGNVDATTGLPITGTGSGTTYAHGIGVEPGPLSPRAGQTIEIPPPHKMTPEKRRVLQKFLGPNAKVCSKAGHIGKILAVLTVMAWLDDVKAHGALSTEALHSGVEVVSIADPTGFGAATYGHNVIDASEGKLPAVQVLPVYGLGIPGVTQPKFENAEQQRWWQRLLTNGASILDVRRFINSMGGLSF